jgi:hypothetical protein
VRSGQKQFFGGQFFEKHETQKLAQFLGIRVFGPAKTETV